MRLAERIASNRTKDRRRIIIDAWGEDGNPATIYVSPLTAGDIDKLQRRHKDFLTNMTIAGMVDLIVMKAEMEDGAKAFTLEDKPILMRESLSVISDVAGQMFADIESAADIEKN